jgi:hypothetical protein
MDESPAGASCDMTLPAATHPLHLPPCTEMLAPTKLNRFVRKSASETFPPQTKSSKRAAVLK